jgi:hypothetical protein
MLHLAEKFQIRLLPAAERRSFQQIWMNVSADRSSVKTEVLNFVMK